MLVRVLARRRVLWCLPVRSLIHVVQELVAHGVVADVVPMAGRVCVFPHRLLHESMAITKGMRKCVVRGDVLYGQGA